MKNNNTLVVCGGTGAHVALALVRLHALGHALGFFRDADDEPLAFPTSYLVDQDSGDGDREATAWQLTRRLVASHPGRHDWRAAIGRPDPPELKIVTPLPVGGDRTWFNPPYDTLGQRFADSPYLDLLASRAQRDIRFSHGMMGSPAVGSLLFRLKEFDTKSSGAGTNHDATYHELLSTRGRVAVAGSAVGGTGASVAGILARASRPPAAPRRHRRVRHQSGRPPVGVAERGTAVSRRSRERHRPRPRRSDGQRLHPDAAGTRSPVIDQTRTGAVPGLSLAIGLPWDRGDG